MNKRIWINVGLLVFILILYTVLTVPDKNESQSLALLSSIDTNEITKIEVIRKELDNFLFNKEGESWKMISPLSVLANNARINAMLRLLKTEVHGQINPNEIELKRFDLDPAKITVKLNEHTFRFGNTDAIDQRRYVLFENKIYLTNDSLYAQLTTNAAFFADTKLLPEGIKINAIQFPENKIEKQNGEWQLQNIMDINPLELKQIVFSWKNAMAISTSKIAEDQTGATITIMTKKDRSIKFVIVKTEPNLILGRKDLGIQYHLGSDEADKLLLKETSETILTE